MSGDDVTKEVTKVTKLEHDVAHTHGSDAKKAEDALQRELASINDHAKTHPGYAQAVLNGLHKAHADSHLKLHNGQLQITPLEAPAKTGQAATAHPPEGAAKSPPRKGDGVDQADAGPPPRPRDNTSLSIEAEQDLLRGGKDSLYNRIVKAPGNEHGGVFGIGASTQDPNSPDTTITHDDVQRYHDQLAAKKNKTAQDQVDVNVTGDLLRNWSKVVPNIGDTFDGDEFISKKSMGMNMARASGHALIDGGANNLFDKIAKERYPYEDPSKAQLRSYDLSEYLDKHASEIPEPQRGYLQYLSRRLEGGRDWAAGLIGYSDDENTYLTKHSIAQGIQQYGLDSFVVNK